MKKRIAIVAVVLLGVVAALVLHDRSRRLVRIYTFEPALSGAVNSVTWIDHNDFLALITSPSGHPIWTRCSMRTGKSYPVADAATQPPDSLIWRFTNSQAAVSPDGKYIAGSKNGEMPWVVPLDKILMPPSVDGAPIQAHLNYFGPGPLKTAYWLPDGQCWINQSLSGEFTIFDRSGRKISSFTGPPPYLAFTHFLGETANGDVLIMLHASGVSGLGDQLFSVDKRTGKLILTSITCPANLHGNVTLALSPRGNKLAWLGVITPHDWMPRWLHKTLLKIGVDASPKKQYVVVVGDLHGRNTHVVLNVDHKNVAATDFGWLPDGKSVYINCCPFNASGQPVMNDHQHIIEAPAD